MAIWDPTAANFLLATACCWSLLHQALTDVGMLYEQVQTAFAQEQVPPANGLSRIVRLLHTFHKDFSEFH